MNYFLGLDVGTKNIKAIIISDKCEVVERSTIPIYDLTIKLKENFVERNPRELWIRVKNCLNKMKYVGKVNGICIDATSGTFTSIDRDGNPLHNFIMYNDRRAIMEAKILRKKSNAAKMFEKYLPITPEMVLPKLVWLKNNFSEFKNIYKILHESDYFVYKLSGNIVTSPNIAGKSSALLDKLGYLEEAYRDMGIDINIMPEIKGIGEIIGYVNKEASRETGLPEGTPIVNGVTDASAGDITSGSIKSGQANVTIGTTLTLHAVVDKLVPDLKKRFYYKAFLNNLYLAGGFTNAGTTSFDAISRLIGISIEELTDMALNVPIGSEGLIACSEWYGVRVPKSYPGLKGFFIGLSEINAKPGHLFRSLLEASSYTLKLLLNAVENTTNVIFKDLRISGGASKNNLFMQIISDVIGREVKVVEEKDSALGSAILAMSSCLRKGIDEIVSKMVKIRGTFTPNIENNKRYEKLSKKYEEIVLSLSKIL
ncbi:MAG: hypothetical protein DRJ34_01970 [Thermoprotei archaeon]|nr:MAG: hypothetical protein DRJ34_01970 [Thermoprotei archaeon]RLE71192.1 MAG: hypothetical protein DRJ45_04145 [Thermoprotei archaeon]